MKVFQEFGEMIKLYLDEDVPETIALSLRLRGYDVVTVKETGKKGVTVIEQLKYAFSENRVIFTHNIANFYKKEILKNV
ncbi:MAG: DUF5615 family PIN-like protein [Candidatus Brocadia sp.]